MKPNGLGERNRLKRRKDFEDAYRHGKRIVSPFFVAFVKATGLRSLRLGVVASRRVGSAVARNRAKRLLREAFRKNVPAAVASADVVLVARQAIGRARYVEVERAYFRLVGHTLGRLARMERGFGGAP